MTIRIVRLGEERERGEGVRIGTVRRPPRGVAASRFAKDDWYDVWYPELSPSAARRTLDVLASLSHGANFSIGCYCEDEARCHRSVLRALLEERGAEVR
jgi:uncharacterized protein YeaO (DUF488 family)